MTLRRSLSTAAAAAAAACFVLAAALLPCAHASAGALPPCSSLPPGAASAVPSGWASDEWREMVRDTMASQDDGSQPPLALCEAAPAQGEFQLYNPIPEQQLENIGYTQRDWARWDAFDLKTDLLHVPSSAAGDTPDANDAATRVWGIGNGATDKVLRTTATNAAPLSKSAGSTPAPGAPLTSANYKRVFAWKMENTYLRRGYNRFRWFGDDPTLDYIEEFKSTTARWDVLNVMMNVSFALNENYNVFRAARRTQIKNRIVDGLRAQGIDPFSRPVDGLIDAEWDATNINWLSNDMPRNQATLDWFERYLQTVMGKQQRTRGAVFVTFNGKPFDVYGCFEGYDGAGYNPVLMFFYSHDFAYMAARWVKLLRSNVIRELRGSMQASLAAQYSAWSYKLTLEDRLLSQWFMRICGFSTSAYFMMRSEAVLRARGEWTSADAITTTDWNVGRVTTSDLLAQCEVWTKLYVTRLENLGASEYLSTYYGVTFDYYEPAILMAPSPALYALFERIVKVLWFDLASAWSPGAAAFTGATGRHHDATTGLHSRSDYWDIPLYLSHLHPPHCAQQLGHTRWDGVKQTEVVNLCTEGAATLAPMTRLWEEFSIVRFHFAAAQAAGSYYLPFDAFVNISLAAPIRTTSGLTTNQLQGMRFTMHTPDYALGFGADDAAGHGLGQIHVARLPGVPVPGSAIAVLKKQAVTQVHAQLRQMTERADDPFFREGYLWGVVGHEIPQVGRTIIAQHQGYQLITSRVSGFTRNQGSDASAPWNTDLLFPITTDAIYADGTLLPVTEGTVIALPLSTVFLVKHGSSSFAVRIIRLETSAASGIKHATQRTNLNAASYAPGAGRQEYSVTWQVDAASALAGSGRVTLHHKHKGDASSGSWKVSTLWAGGRTRTMAEAFALQRSLRHAAVTETITPNAAWDASKQPWTGGPAGWNGYADVGEEEWSTEVRIGASVQLKVRRTDAYNPWTNLPAYKHATAAVQIAPYYIRSFERLAQGAAMFPEFTGASLSWNKAAIQTKPIEASALLEPHLTEPRDCIPGVDFPCYRWNPTDWGACSVSCKTGTHTRSVQCVDASNSNSLASSPSLCPTMEPMVQESCNMGPCYPSAPTITKVQALDGFIEVWFDAPADNGGDATTPAGAMSYIVLPSPADVGTTGSASPIKLGPLTNGRSYTIRMAAINSRGTGALSDATAAVVPDAFRWTFDAWGICDSPCNGGTQRRTAKCVGAAAGAVDPSKCTDPAPSASELARFCNVQSCVWQPTAWSTCSSECSGGTQTRTAPCSSGIQSTGGKIITVDPWWCRATTAPATSQSCNTQACQYQLTEWSTCSRNCGSGTQTRQASCYNGAGGTLTMDLCAAKIGAAPATSQSCNTQACLPNQWVATSWSGCDQLCGGGLQTRSTTCQDADGRTLASTACSAASAPVTQRECNTAACVWKTEPFGACSSPCGGGTQERSVACADALGTGVATSRCLTPAPASSASCNTHPCTWVPGPWSNCSAEACGTGVQTRSGQCTDGAVQTLPAEKCASVPFESSTPCASTDTCIGAPAPVTVTKVVALDGRALIHFDAAPSDGSGDTPSYFAQVEPVDVPGQPPIASAFEVDGAGAIPQMGAMTAYATSSPIEVIGLTNGRSYRFSVVSVNSMGPGEPSSASAVIVPYPAPGVPILGVILAGDGELIANFVPAALAPGEPASSFQAWAIPANDTSAISSDMLASWIQGEAAVGTASPLTLGGLSSSMRYVIAVRAVSPSGHSDVVLSDRGHYPDAAVEPVVEDTTTLGQPPVPTGSSSESGSSSTLTIALAIVIPLVALLALAAGVLWYRRRQAAGKLESSSTDITREVSQVHTTWPRTDDTDTEAGLTAMSPSPSPSPDAPAIPSSDAASASAGHRRFPSVVRIDMDGSSQQRQLLGSPLASPSIVISAPSGLQQSYAPVGREGEVPMASPDPPLGSPSASPSPSPSPSPPPPRQWGGVVQRWQTQ